MARIALNLNPFNPVALREMRARMRGPKAFVLLGLYLGLLAVLMYVIYLRSGGGSTYTYGGFSGSTNFGPTKSFEIGQNLFITAFLYLIIFVTVVTPAITGGMVSRELEGRTYELLVITPVRSRSVAFGKLLAALSFVFFMVLSALPMACIVFIFGGVTGENILIGFGVVLMAAITFGIIGLFFSALVKRTGVAVMLTYGVIALLVIGSWLASNSITASLNSEASRIPSGAPRPDPRLDPNFDLPKRILVVNPVAALGSVLARNAPYRASNGEDLQVFPNSKFYGGNPNTYYANSSGNRDLNAAARRGVLPGDMPLWGGYFLVYTALALFFFLLSLLMVKPGIRVAFPGRRQALPKAQKPPKLKKARKVATAKVVTSPETPVLTTFTPEKVAPEKAAPVSLLEEIAPELLPGLFDEEPEDALPALLAEKGATEPLVPAPAAEKEAAPPGPIALG